MTDMEALLTLDSRLFLAINGWHSPVFDQLMWWVSGKTSWWPFYLAILIFIAWKRAWQLVPLIVAIAALIVLADQSSVHLFKEVFQRFRPCHEPALQGMVHIVNNKCGGSWGFISSHAANSGGVAMLLLLFMRTRWFSFVMVFWALLIAYSRVYLGVHYPGDVLAGLLWGAACGYLVFLLLGLALKRLPGHWWIVKGRAHVVHSE